MKELTSFMIAIAVLDHVYPQITLTSNPMNLSGVVCPGTLQVTCDATDFETTLQWAFDNIPSTTFIATYVFNDAGDIPWTFSENNVTVVVSRAVQNQQNMDLASFSSTLTTSLSTLKQFNVQRVLCGSARNSEALPIGNFTVRAPPPLPVFTCSLADDGQNVTFHWDNRYNSVNDVDHYCLDSAACSTCDISPSTPFVCNELQIGEQYTFSLRAVNCGDQRGSSDNVAIDLQSTPQSLRNVEVISSYNNSTLYQIEVRWMSNGSARFSNKCEHKATNYVITLQNSLASSIEQEINSLSDSCDDSSCSVTFNISQPRGIYQVFVDTITVVGTDRTTLPSLISPSADELLQPSFEFVNCITYATCSSPSLGAGECVISYNSISGTGTATETLNDRFALPLLDPNTNYRFVTNLTINSSFTVEVHTTFTTGDFAPKLTGSNVGMIVVGVILLIAAICVAVVVAIALCSIFGKRAGTCYSVSSRLVIGRRNFRKWMIFIVVFFMVDVVSTAVTLILWISIGALVEKQENTCDVPWQQSRENLMMASFVFSILSLLISVTGGAVVFPYCLIEQCRKVHIKTPEKEASASNEIKIESFGKTGKDWEPEGKKVSSDNENRRKNDAKKSELDGEKAAAANNPPKTTQDNNAVDDFKPPNPKGKVQEGAPMPKDE